MQGNIKEEIVKMKTEEQIMQLLKSYEGKKRRAFKEKDDLRFQAYNYVTRTLKIILEIPIKQTGKGRIVKSLKSNDEILKFNGKKSK